MKTSFFSRFVSFSVAFYVGSVVAVFILTIVKTATYFQHHFWPWLLSWMIGDVVPITIAELFRSPVMGLLFALLGARWLSRNTTIKFGLACGAFSYAVAYFFSVLGGNRGTLAQTVIDYNLIEYFLLGLPVGLVLLSRLFAVQNVQT